MKNSDWYDGYLTGEREANEQAIDFLKHIYLNHEDVYTLIENRIIQEIGRDEFHKWLHSEV